ARSRAQPAAPPAAARLADAAPARPAPRRPWLLYWNAYRTRHPTPTHAERFISFSSNGLNRPGLAFLVSHLPVSRCASWRKGSPVGWDEDISAIIWPLLAAVPKTCGSNGMIAAGSSSSALAKSAGLISGRLGTPT